MKDNAMGFVDTTRRYAEELTYLHKTACDSLKDLNGDFMNMTKIGHEGFSLTERAYYKNQLEILNQSIRRRPQHVKRVRRRCGAPGSSGTATSASSTSASSSWRRWSRRTSPSRSSLLHTKKQLRSCASG